MKLARTGYYDQFLTGIQFPKMVGITIQYEDRKIDDVAATTREELVGSGYLDLVRGKTVAGCGKQRHLQFTSYGVRHHRSAKGLRSPGVYCSCYG